MGRTLVYIPVIHTDPDLGSLAADVEEKTARLLGGYWIEHKNTVKRYWQEIARFITMKKFTPYHERPGRKSGDEWSKYPEGQNLKPWMSVHGTGFTKVLIFQDGLPEGGDTARVIIDKLAQTGSPNYQLLKRLLETGAQIQKTEDPELLKQEYQLTKDLVAGKNLVSAVVAVVKYKLNKNRLLNRRDDYIAKQINQNLPEGETGICFLGAYHEVLSKLAGDIKIVLVKNPDKVKQYYQRLAWGETAGTINDLARYLTKPVINGVSFNHNLP